MNTSSDRTNSIVLWLLSRSGEEEKAWLVQPHTGPLNNLSPSAEAWQVPITANGLQRLANRWQQNGKPTIALKIATANMSDLTEHDNPALPRWQVRGWANATKSIFLPAGNRDLGEIALLAKAGLRAMPVIGLASPPLEASGTASEPEQPPQIQLAHMLFLRKGRPALKDGFFSLRPGLPSPTDFALALVVGSACAAIGHLPSEVAIGQFIAPTLAVSTDSSIRLQERQLLETCTLPSTNRNEASSEDEGRYAP